MAFLDVQAERNGNQSRGRVVSERVELGMAKKTGGNEKRREFLKSFEPVSDR